MVRKEEEAEEEVPRSYCSRLATYGSGRASTAGAWLKIDPASQLAKPRPLSSFYAALCFNHTFIRPVFNAVGFLKGAIIRLTATAGSPVQTAGTKRQTVRHDLRRRPIRLQPSPS